VSYAAVALHFCPKKRRSYQRSKITSVLRTKTVTDRYVNRLVWVYYQEISNCCNQFWLTNRLMTSVTDRLLIMYGNCCDSFFFVTAAVYSWSQDFFIWLMWTAFSWWIRSPTAYFIRQILWNFFWLAKSLSHTWQFATITSWAWQFFEHKVVQRHI